METLVLHACQAISQAHQEENAQVPRIQLAVVAVYVQTATYVQLKEFQCLLNVRLVRRQVTTAPAV